MFGARILVLVPHPDDEVVGCAAAIGRARREGCALYACYLTDGVPAAGTLWPWQRRGRAARAERRWREAKRAAAALGLTMLARPILPTRSLKDHLDATLERIGRAARETAATMLWVPAYEGGHQDHDVASFLAARLRRQLPVWEFSEYHFAGGRVASQRFIAPSGEETELTLNDGEQGEKRRLLALYRSERGNLGYVGCDREVFRPQVDYDYARPPHSGRTFYQRFQWVPRHPRIDYTTPEEVSAALTAFAAGRGAAGP